MLFRLIPDLFKRSNGAGLRKMSKTETHEIGADTIAEDLESTVCP